MLMAFLSEGVCACSRVCELLSAVCGFRAAVSPRAVLAARRDRQCLRVSLWVLVGCAKDCLTCACSRPRTHTSSLDHQEAVQYAGLICILCNKARSAVRELDPSSDVTFLRLRSNKHEILVAPGLLFHNTTTRDGRNRISVTSVVSKREGVVLCMRCACFLVCAGVRRGLARKRARKHALEVKRVYAYLSCRSCVTPP